MRELEEYEKKMVASAWPRFQSWHSVTADEQEMVMPGRPPVPAAYAELYELVAN